MEQKNTERFSHTAEHYAQHRPSYPKKLINYLTEKGVIYNNSIIADIGSGTGLFTQLLLETGASVVAVEPNNEMRIVAEHNLKKYCNFESVNATAEKTTLEDNSVDLITAATAFHWFDYEACKKEFKRILKPHGSVLLVWNLRLAELSPVTQGYETILKKNCPEYKGIPSQQITEQKFLDFFGTSVVDIIKLDNHQQFDLNGLIGRLRSTSYALTPEQAGYDAMIDDITALFQQYAENGLVTFPYLTKAYHGKLN